MTPNIAGKLRTFQIVAEQRLEDIARHIKMNKIVLRKTTNIPARSY